MRFPGGKKEIYMIINIRFLRSAQLRNLWPAYIPEKVFWEGLVLGSGELLNISSKGITLFDF